jgi:hypothetical protein
MAEAHTVYRRAVGAVKRSGSKRWE